MERMEGYASTFMIRMRPQGIYDIRDIEFRCTPDHTILITPGQYFYTGVFIDD